jgi:hypothetical protein
MSAMRRNDMQCVEFTFLADRVVYLVALVARTFCSPSPPGLGHTMLMEVAGPIFAVVRSRTFSIRPRDGGQRTTRKAKPCVTEVGADIS